MKGVSTRKIVSPTIPNVDLQAVQTGVFGEEGDQRYLVTLGGDDQVTSKKQSIEEVAGSVVSADIVKACVGRIRSVEGRVIAAEESIARECERQRMTKWSGE